MRALRLLLSAMLLAACATTSDLERSRQLIEAGKPEEALAYLEQLVADNPGNPQYRSALASQRELIVNRWLTEAETLRSTGAYVPSEGVYRRVLKTSPGNPRAMAGLALIEAEQRADRTVQLALAELKKGDLAAAEARLREALLQVPHHRAARALVRRLEERRAAQSAAPGSSLGPHLSKPVSLQFREASLRQVFEVIARSHGINFVFDKDVRSDMRVTIFVRDTAVEDVVKLILATNQLSHKVLNQNSILIYPNTPVKAREYQELVTRSFYLGNADAKQTLNMVRTLVKTRDVYIDEKLNLIVMRDTPAAVRYAEKLIITQDLAEPEVMLEVEVLEVSRSRLQELGVRFPERVNFGPLDVPFGAQFEFSSGALTASVTNPAFILNLRQLDGATNVLANPRIRVRNREKARVHIGEKVPVVTTTSTANVGVSSSVSYLDVGLKLDVEPNVYLEDEIAIKVGLEVSNIIETINTTNTIAYRLGSRNAVTTLRLRDGETQVLAGLIQEEDRRAANRVPGLGEMPVVGRLFSNTNDEVKKTEIVLLITPHVLRNILRPEARFAEIPSGTEAAIGAEPFVLRAPASAQLSIAPTGAQSGPVPAAAPRSAEIPAPAPVELAWAAPPQAQIGSEIGIQLGLATPGIVRRASFELAYDPSMLAPIGDLESGQTHSAPGSPAPSGTGRLPVVIDTSGGSGIVTRNVRFRVIAQKPGPTRLSVESLSAVGTDEQPLTAVVPPPHTLAIVPQ